jgi:hypothetical protein
MTVRDWIWPPSCIRVITVCVLILHIGVQVRAVQRITSWVRVSTTFNLSVAYSSDKGSAGSWVSIGSKLDVKQIRLNLATLYLELLCSRMAARSTRLELVVQYLPRGSMKA